MFLISIRGNFFNFDLLYWCWYFIFNIRDNVEWTDDQKQHAEEVVKKNSIQKFSQQELKSLEEAQSKNWDSFYEVHQNKFFKDRHWLFTEFPELAPNAVAPERVYPKSEDVIVKDMIEMKLDSKAGRRIFELGSGVGNSKFYFAQIYQLKWSGYYFWLSL